MCFPIVPSEVVDSIESDSKGRFENILKEDNSDEQSVDYLGHFHQSNSEPCLRSMKISRDDEHMEDGSDLEISLIKMVDRAEVKFLTLSSFVFRSVVTAIIRILREVGSPG